MQTEQKLFASFSRKRRPSFLPPRVLVLAGGGLAHTSGGVGTLMQYLLDAWTAQPDAPVVTVIDTRGQGGRAAGAWRFAVAIGMVALLCGMRRVDLVHAHMTTRGSVLRKCVLCGLAMAMRVPVVVHMHGADFFDFFAGLPGFLRALVGGVLRRASHVLVLGRAWRDGLGRACALDPGRVRVVLNGVKAPGEVLRDAHGGAPRILFLGRLGTRKGVPELIAALALPELRGRAWKTVIAGDGDVAAFRAMAAAGGVGDRVDVPGWADRAAVAALLARADLLVLPSYHEALPMAVLEALARGLPVITTPVGAIPEFLTDGVDALLVPPGDVAALAGALARLLDDAELRARLGTAGQAVFRARLDIGVTAALVLGIYREACGGGQCCAPEGIGRVGRVAGA